MPRISAFYGIVITMYWRDHPPAHFHASYAGHVAEVAIDTLEVIDGWLPPRALRLVIEWAETHQTRTGRELDPSASVRAARCDRSSALAFEPWLPSLTSSRSLA